MSEDKSKRINNYRSSNKYSEEKKYNNNSEEEKHNNNKNNTNFKGKNLHNKKKEIEVVNYTPQTRKSKGIKKTLEVTNVDGEKDTLKLIKLDDDSTSQEIIDTLQEFDTFCADNDLYGDYEYEASGMNSDQVETQEKVLEKASKLVFKYFKSILKDTLKSDWEEAVKEVIDGTKKHSKDTFQETMKVFLKETLPSDTTELILKYVKKTKKPYNMSSKKWAKKVVQCLQFREFLDENARKIETREIVEEILFPNVPEFWYKNLVRNGIKPDVSIKEFVKNIENYEEYERKFPSEKGNHNSSNFRSNGNQYKNDGDSHYKKNMCRIPGHNHEWKDCFKNPNNKIKKEENNNISDESSESSSDESMRMMDYESDEDEYFYDTYSKSSAESESEYDSDVSNTSNLLNKE